VRSAKVSVDVGKFVGQHGSCACEWDERPRNCNLGKANEGKTEGRGGRVGKRAEGRKLSRLSCGQRQVFGPAGPIIKGEEGEGWEKLGQGRTKILITFMKFHKHES